MERFKWVRWLALGLAGVVVATGAVEPQAYRRSMERVSSLDPVDASSIYAARCVQLVYETLLEYDYTTRPYKLVPGVAEALPEVSEDGRVYILRLRPAARFHPHPCFGVDGRGQPQGRALRASDVVFSLKRLADRKLSSSGTWLVENEIKGMREFANLSSGEEATDYGLEVEGLRALDERTLRIELVKPLHVFSYYLAMAYSAVVAPEAVAWYGSDFVGHSVGSAGYRLGKWRHNHQITFERVPGWWGWQQGAAVEVTGGRQVSGPELELGVPSGRPFDVIDYRMIDDSSTQWLCFLSSELDFLGEISRDNWDAVIGPEGKLEPELIERGIRLHTIPTLEVAYIGINMEDPVLGGNRALRQALNCAFDSDSWVRFYNNRAICADGPLPPGVAGRLESEFAYHYNLEKAKRLLEEAGYPGGIDPKNGRRLELTIDLGRTSQDVRESVELMVAYMARLGVVLTPQFHNWPVFLKRVSNRQSQIFRIGWMGDYPDAQNFMQLFYSRNVSPGPNRTNYVNPEFDKLYEAACAAQSEAERLELWQRAQEIIREDCPWIFLHFQKAYSLCGPRVENYVPSDFPYGAEKFLRVSGSNKGEVGRER